MFIKEISALVNYRNLTGLTMKFDKKINFIVGENNIGKTNLIELMDKVIRIGKFDEADFNDIREKIVLEFTIRYSDLELGFFENTFDIDDELTITIRASQDNVDSRLEYCHSESEANINPKTIKMLNFVYYSSLRMPNKELNFNNNIGTGKVLRYIMKKSLESQDIDQMDLIKQAPLNRVIRGVNKRLKKLNGLSSESIQAYLSDDNENIVNRILEIGDVNKRSISELGDGLQYSFNIFLNILELLVHLKTTKSDENFDALLIRNSNGKRYLPIILGLDEPEIHQHPYRQRALIKSISDIINNGNRQFVRIIKDLFDIDGFIGQLFITTHSPSILLNDYRQITRLYKDEEVIKAACGSTIRLSGDTKKHLMRSFVYFKEAMFARAIILVEGDTEYGAVPVFAKRLGWDLDRENVGVFKLDGADGVKKYLELFNEYKIEANAILDKDKEDTYPDDPHITFTAEIDFEEEMFKAYSFDNYLKYLKSTNKHACLAARLNSKIDGFNRREFIRKPLEYEIPNTVKLEVMSEIETNELEQLRNLKNAVNGALLAEFVDVVPESFENIIADAIWEDTDD